MKDASLWHFRSVTNTYSISRRSLLRRKRSRARVLYKVMVKVITRVTNRGLVGILPCRNGSWDLMTNTVSKWEYSSMNSRSAPVLVEVRIKCLCLREL